MILTCRRRLSGLEVSKHLLPAVLLAHRIRSCCLTPQILKAERAIAAVGRSDSHIWLASKDENDLTSRGWHCNALSLVVEFEGGRDNHRWSACLLSSGSGRLHNSSLCSIEGGSDSCTLEEDV